MQEKEFLASLEDLTGKVAVVTGGTQGIGQSTAVYLALLGATVYACAPDRPREHVGVEEALARVERYPDDKQAAGSIQFHKLDLGSVREARASARALIEKLESTGAGRLDILVCNAAVVSSSNDLTEDGYDETFAVNCLGHFVFIKELLETIKSSAISHGEARITITSSDGHKWVSGFDYEVCTNPIVHEGRSALQIMNATWQRYLNSKLGALYVALELDRRLQDAGVKNVFVNAVHPGNVGKTSLGDWNHTFISPANVKHLKRVLFLGHLVSNSAEDAAKTQTYVSASKVIPEQQAHGEYWSPKFSLWPFFGSWMRYTGSTKEELKPHAAKPEEWLKFWEYCSEAEKKVEA